MSALTVRLPSSVHDKVRELAERDHVSVNQFIASAVAEKMAAVLTLDHLRREAAQGRHGLSTPPHTTLQAGHGVARSGVASLQRGNCGVGAGTGAACASRRVR